MTEKLVEMMEMMEPGELAFLCEWDEHYLELSNHWIAANVSEIREANNALERDAFLTASRWFAESLVSLEIANVYALLSRALELVLHNGVEPRDAFEAIRNYVDECHSQHELMSDEVEHMLCAVEGELMERSAREDAQYLREQRGF